MYMNSFMYESEIMMCKAMSGLIQGERKLDYDKIENETIRKRRE